MSRPNKRLQTATATIQEPTRHGDVPDQSLGGWPINKPFPALLGDADLRQVFDISETTFLRWKRMGRFTAFEVSPEAGVRRYSGLLVQRYVSGVSLNRRRA